MTMFMSFEDRRRAEEEIFLRSWVLGKVRGQANLKTCIPTVGERGLKYSSSSWDSKRGRGIGRDHGKCFFNGSDWAEIGLSDGKG